MVGAHLVKIDSMVWLLRLKLCKILYFTAYMFFLFTNMWIWDEKVPYLIWEWVLCQIVGGGGLMLILTHTWKKSFNLFSCKKLKSTVLSFTEMGLVFKIMSRAWTKNVFGNNLVKICTHIQKYRHQNRYYVNTFLLLRGPQNG